MKHTINGQIAGLSATVLGENRIDLYVTGARSVMLFVTGEQISAFAVPVRSMVAVTIAAPEHETEQTTPPAVVIRGQIIVVGLDDMRHPFIDFLPDRLRDDEPPSKPVRFSVDLSAVQEFGASIGFPATITVAPIG